MEKKAPQSAIAIVGIATTAEALDMLGFDLVHSGLLAGCVLIGSLGRAPSPRNPLAEEDSVADSAALDGWSQSPARAYSGGA